MARRKQDVLAEMILAQAAAGRSGRGIGATVPGAGAGDVAALGAPARNAIQFGQALGSRNTPGFDAHDQAAAYAAAGAPEISAEFAQAVANGDPDTMAFVELLKRQQPVVRDKLGLY